MRLLLGNRRFRPRDVRYASRWLGFPERLPERPSSWSDAVAHVVTIDEDGGPQVTAAWVGIEGDEIVLATLPDQRKLRNLRRDPRIALSVPSTTTNEWGLLEYLAVYGTAQVTEGGAAEVLQRLAYTYIGPTLCSRTCPIPRRDSSQGSRPNALAASGRGTRHAARHRRFHHGSSRIGRTITTTSRARPPTPPEELRFLSAAEAAACGEHGAASRHGRREPCETNGACR